MRPSGFKVSRASPNMVHASPDTKAKHNLISMNRLKDFAPSNCSDASRMRPAVTECTAGLSRRFRYLFSTILSTMFKDLVWNLARPDPLGRCGPPSSRP